MIIGYFNIDGKGRLPVSIEREVNERVLKMQERQKRREEKKAREGKKA